MLRAMIDTDQLTKYFGNSCAVDHIDWEVPAGSICGLLGPNGAGKTTTLKMLLGMTQPSSGSATVNDLNIIARSVDIRKCAAFLPEDHLAYDSMTGQEFLRFYASFFPDWSSEVVADLPRRWKIPLKQKIGSLSRGTRKKLLLAAAFARKPEILLLDEPTDGTDPAGVEEILTLLTQWISAGVRTMVIATHRLDEIERVCDRVTIMNQGKILLTSDLDDLRAQWKSIEITGNVGMDSFKDWNDVHTVQEEGNRIRITTHSNPENVVERLKGISVFPTNIFDMNLREIYLASIDYPGTKSHDLENLV